MKLARTALGLGVVEGETFAPLDADLLDVLALTPPERDALPRGAGVPLPELLAPIAPATIRDYVTFEEHVEGIAGEVAPEWYEAPTFYFTNVHAVTGPYDDVPVPPGSERFDFELEVAAVIGRPGRDLTPAQAREHIAAYTIFNDWSARDIQFREMQVRLGPCKGKDSANTLGPWLVTADELEPHRGKDGRLDLDLRVWRNGEPFGDDTLANMGWSFEEMVAYASRGTWVRPGDVLGSGTCGSGCLAELLGRGQDVTWLQPGDEIAIAVEGIGRIANRIVAGVDPVPIGPARPATRRERSWAA
jgi:2-keto-4-pentenoate hydratase/2-oxohepta-3-ene-1,7-dioic acid hydratase in catechol pathway